MASSALAGWNVGRDAWDDMPPGIPVGGGAPPPPGATFLGGGDPMATAFPGLSAASPGRIGGSHPNLPALDAAYANWPHATPAWHGYPLPHPHTAPASPYAPLPGGYPQPGWPGYTPWHGHIPLGPPAGPTYPPPPAWHVHSPWPGGFRGEDAARGRKEQLKNWFAEEAKAKRSRSHGSHVRRGSKSPHHRHPAFESYFDEPEEYDEEEEEDDRHRHGGTNYFLNGFRGLSIGGHGTPQGRKRSLSFNGGDGRPAVYHRRSISNPIYQGYYITYEQHMQRHGYGGAREEDLPYRPSSWRSDYSVKGGMFHILGVGMGLKRSTSDVKEINDTHKRNLHPHLHFTGTSTIPSISLDLRLNPEIPPFVAPALHLLSLPQNPHGISNVDLLQFATHPPCTTMRLFHKRLPWYIDIDVSSRRGNKFITIQDVISELFTSLTGQGMSGKSQVTSGEYWCGEMGDHVEATPPPPAYGALPGSTPLMRAITPLPGILGGGGGGQRRSKHTAREQVSMSWRVRGRLAHHIEWSAWRAKGRGEEAALAEAAKAEQDELARGVRRVDWLAIGTNVEDQRAFRWIGLKKARRGMWEIVTEV